MLNVLETILQHKREVIGNTPDFNELAPSQRSFYDALNQPHYGFIMECKKASPSKGLIRESFDIGQIVPVYDQYADAISVLTEERFFRGSFANLAKARLLTDKPILCKDFILTPKQIRQARHFGSDAVLLMLSVLNDRDYQACYEQASSLNMDVLTEIHTEAELERAIQLGAKIIGINNRNLKDLSTSFEHTKQLVDKVPGDRLIITESGITTHSDVLELSQLSDGCLVGSSLMKEADLECAARQLVYGDIKVCGVTQQSDATKLETLPASSIGIIFAPSSKRRVSDTIQTSQKPLVGVFQNQEIDDVVSNALKYQLDAIQLHGDETLEFALTIRQQLPAIKLSKVIHVSSDVSQEELENELEHLLEHYDEILLDSISCDGEKIQLGGTGETFDWSLLQSLDSESLAKKIRIAGGVSSANIQQLKQMGITKLDLSSSVELSPGVKSPELLADFFNMARPQSSRKPKNSIVTEIYKQSTEVVATGVSS